MRQKERDDLRMSWSDLDPQTARGRENDWQLCVQQGMHFVFEDTIQHLESELIRSVTQIVFSLMQRLLVCKKP